MSSIKDQIRISASAAKVYEALTTEAGYRGWWNKIAEVPSSVGGEAKLCFDKDGQAVNMRFCIDEQQPHQGVRWSCIAHDMPSWVGTRLSWSLRPEGDATVVSLEHSGWQEEAPEPVVQGWKHFMGSLKAYLETGTGQPW